jgi:hypothetical protein
MRLWPSLDRRRIFRYHDGLQVRKVDPLAAYRELDCHPAFNLDKHTTILFQASTGQTSLADKFDRGEFLEATGAAAAAAHDVFHVPKFEYGGLPEHDCVGLVLLFLAYVDRLSFAYHADADAAAFYGCDMERIRKTDYPRFVAYSLLIPRGTLRRANEVRVGCVAGIESALAGAPVPLPMLKSVVNDPELAEKVHARQARQQAEASNAS